MTLTSEMETYVRDAAFGQVLFGQWLPRTFTAKTTDDFRRVTQSAREGDLMSYRADVTSGTTWMFVYQSDGSAYPWKYIGGAPLSSEVAASQSTASTTYTDLATVGPTLTVPLNGDYDVTISAWVQSPGSGTVSWMSYSIGSAAASDSDAIRTFSSPVGQNESSGSRQKRKTDIASGSVLTAKYKTSNVAGTGFWEARAMKITPVRVG